MASASQRSQSTEPGQNHPSGGQASGDDDFDTQKARTVFEQFLMTSPYLATSPDGNLRLKNTFLQVQEDEDFPLPYALRSSTAPAEFTEEIFRLARTITRDPHVLAQIAESIDSDNVGSDLPDFSSVDLGTSFSTSTPTSVISPTVITAPEIDMNDETTFTTVMLRNIPNKYTQTSLLESIDEMGFAGLYDFFYLPVDFKNGCNMGYAFVNFIDHSSASLFKTAFKGYQLPARSAKVCDSCWARVQGIKANIEHYRNSPVNDLPDPEYRPLLFQNGVEVAFPRPDPSVKRSAGRRKTSPDSGSRGSVAPPGFAESDAPVKLFIGGLASVTRDGDIRAHFTQFGTVRDAMVVMDKKTGMSRGFGFCSFINKSAADNVMHTRQHLINGQSVGVRFYQQGK